MVRVCSGSGSGPDIQVSSQQGIEAGWLVAFRRPRQSCGHLFSRIQLLARAGAPQLGPALHQDSWSCRGFGFEL